MVTDRMQADSDAEAAAEAADSAAAALVHLFVDEEDDVIMQE
jgi:hypothetical protein